MLLLAGVGWSPAGRIFGASAPANTTASTKERDHVWPGTARNTATARKSRCGQNETRSSSGTRRPDPPTNRFGANPSWANRDLLALESTAPVGTAGASLTTHRRIPSRDENTRDSTRPRPLRAPVAGW